MPILSIEDVRPGMVLAEAVTNHQERVLLGAGRRITERSLSLFRSWGVLTVAVRGESSGGERAASAPPPGSPGLDAELARRFEGVLSDPLMQAIHDAVRRQLAARRGKTMGGDGRA
jgi:hypothetical protein